VESEDGGRDGRWEGKNTHGHKHPGHSEKIIPV
jgi:hypothetical protein